MKISCPHCSQNLEIVDEWAGHAMSCPSCQQAFTVPSPADTPKRDAAPNPHANAPKFKRPQTSVGSASAKSPRRKGGGAGKLLVALLLLTGAGFGYAIMRYDESPQQVWNRLVIMVERFGKQTSPPVPAPVVAQPTAPAPKIAESAKSAESAQIAEPAEANSPTEPEAPPASMENPDSTPSPESESVAGSSSSLQPQKVSRAVVFPKPRYSSPGVILNRQDLEILKANIKREPWKSGFEALSNEGRSKLTYKMAGPFKEVKRAPNANLWPWRGDMIAIWNLSRMWYFTGDEAYAKKAHDILLAWATTHTEFGGRESMLDLGDYVICFVGGADILRGTWPGWTNADTAAVKKYFNDVLMPASNPYGESQFGAANKGGLALASLGLMAIFNEDTARLTTVVAQARSLAHIGLRSSNEIGMLGDSLRDQGHAHGQLVSLLTLAEALWKQGIDIYSDYDNRFLAAGEYFARINIPTPTPFIPFGTTDAYYVEDRTNHGWGGGKVALNLIHGAYNIRKGLPAPYTLRRLETMPVDGENFMFVKEVDHSVATPLLPPQIPATASITSGFNNAEIGGALPAGGASYSKGVWKVQGGGSEMWKAEDSCHFTYKEMTGNCAIIAKVESIQNTSPSAKAGVMMRTSLDKNAPRAWMAMTSDGQLQQNMQNLVVYGGTNYSNKVLAKSLSSYWVKLERMGNIIMGYVSPDGTNWAATDVGRIDGPLPRTIYVGLTVCSSANGTLNTSSFSHVEITGGNGGAPIFTPAAPAALLATPGDKVVPLRWQPSFGATSYIIKRSTSGGPYTTVASDITASSFMDTTVTNGVTYRYVVSARNSAGTSPDSAEDSVTPTAPSWNVSCGGAATATVGAETAGSAFDGNSHTIWFAGNTRAAALQYDFGAGQTPLIKSYTITSPVLKPERDPRNWEFQGSKDGTNWVTLDTRTDQLFPLRFYEMEYALAKPAAYRYFRLNVTANNGDNILHIADVKLLSDTPMKNAATPSRRHWKTNGEADREYTIRLLKSAESRE